MTILAKHCLCGATMHGRVSPHESAVGIAAMFDEFHVGGGHGPATAAQAAAARRREGRRLEREWQAAE